MNNKDSDKKYQLDERFYDKYFKDKIEELKMSREEFFSTRDEKSKNKELRTERFTRHKCRIISVTKNNLQNMQKCEGFMDDLRDFIHTEFMVYISKKREHQMKKLIKKCYEKKYKQGKDIMINFLRNDNNKQKSKLPSVI